MTKLTANILKFAIDQSIKTDSRYEDNIQPSSQCITYDGDILVLQLKLIIAMLELNEEE